MDPAQSAQFLTCEYFPPGNVIGQFECASYPHSAESTSSRIYFLSAKTFKREARIPVFYRAGVYLFCAGERVSSVKSLVVVGWASVDSLFCELVASGCLHNVSNGIRRHLPMIVCVGQVRSALDHGRNKEDRSPIVGSEATPNASMSPSWLPTLSTLGYLVLTLITTAFVCLSCASLLVQAIRASPSQSIKNNWNVVIIGTAYVLVVRPFLLVCGRRYELTWW